MKCAGRKRRNGAEHIRRPHCDGQRWYEPTLRGHPSPIGRPPDQSPLLRSDPAPDVGVGDPHRAATAQLSLEGHQPELTAAADASNSLEKSGAHKTLKLRR